MDDRQELWIGEAAKYVGRSVKMLQIWPCGTRTISLDKGYTEVSTDSDGDRQGLGLGTLLTAKSDANKVRYAGRQTVAAIADKHLVKGRYRKYERIVKHNLGRHKIVRQKARHRAVIRTKVFTATHAVVDKAATLVVEDLARPIVGYDRGKNSIAVPRVGSRDSSKKRW